MSATPIAFTQPGAGPAPFVQIDVGSLIALIGMVARHVDLAPREGRAGGAAGSAQEGGTAVGGAPGGQRPHLRPVPGPAEPGARPEAALVSLLMDTLTPMAGKGAAADVVPLRPATAARTFPFGKASLHVDSARLVDVEGRDVPLTAMEFRLLRLFAENRGRVLNRDQILEGAHDRSWDPFDRSIDIRISRIRKKIEHNPKKPEVIRTVRGIGYVYDPG